LNRQLAYLREIGDGARRNGPTDAWLTMLTLAIGKNQLLLPVWTLERRLRVAVPG
jgi:hypothetical protein